jgi:DNA-binding transcriptional MerR regulator
MTEPLLYPIRYVSRRTGLPAHLIRTWETRYQAVAPRRSEGKRRLFCEKDIKRLQLLSKAVEAGHSISQVARLSIDALLRLSKTDSHETVKNAADFERQSRDAGYFLELALSQVIDLDANKLAASLDSAAVHLTRSELITDVIVPLFVRIKKLLQKDSLREINTLEVC